MRYGMFGRIGRAAALLLGLVPAAAGAQDYGGFNRGDRPGVFDFYVLALSWSPTYCESATQFTCTPS